MSVNLIVNQGMANIFHQTVDLLCVLGVFEEMQEILLRCNRVHSLTNLFQFPGNPGTSDLALDPGECGLTVPALLPSPPH